MKKVIILSAILLLGFSIANAQGTRFGAKAGVNISGVSGDDVDGTSSRTGLNVGGVAIFELGDIINLQPEATFSMRGWEDGEFKIKLVYIDVPIMADVEIAEGLSLQGGPVLGVNVSAKVEDGDGNEADIEDISTLNAGVGIGAQYILPMGLFFNIRYDIGLNDVIDSDFNAKNNNIGIAAGFLFN